MGCETRQILHRMPGMTHNMYVCLPGQVSQQEAQSYWDAYNAYYLCLQNDTRTADDCARLVADGFETELALVAGAVPAGFQEATYAAPHCFACRSC